MSQLDVESVSKTYGNRTVLSDVTFSVPSGFYALLGPSGSGKTTMLRVIAGFVTPDAGRVVIDGDDITERPPHRRDIGFVFQNYALFPHMSVFNNIAFGLRMRKASRSEVNERVIWSLALAKISHLAASRPQNLSGGEQQRVAVARSLVTQPRLLLLDEPLSALDRMIRQSMRAELKRIQRETGITTIIVTHDQEEALDLADAMLILESGAVRQIGSPAQVYERPTDPFVATFMGSANVFEVKLVREDGKWFGELGDRRFAAAAPSSVSSGTPDEVAATATVRPEHVRLLPRHTGGSGAMAGKVVESSFSGPITRVTVDVGGVVLTSFLLSTLGSEVAGGVEVDVELDAEGLRYYLPVDGEHAGGERSMT